MVSVIGWKGPWRAEDAQACLEGHLGLQVKFTGNDERRLGKIDGTQCDPMGKGRAISI